MVIIYHVDNLIIEGLFYPSHHTADEKAVVEAGAGPGREGESQVSCPLPLPQHLLPCCLVPPPPTWPSPPGSCPPGTCPHYHSPPHHGACTPRILSTCPHLTTSTSTPQLPPLPCPRQQSPGPLPTGSHIQDMSPGPILKGEKYRVWSQENTYFNLFLNQHSDALTHINNVVTCMQLLVTIVLQSTTLRLVLCFRSQQTRFQTKQIYSSSMLLGLLRDAVLPPLY